MSTLATVAPSGSASPAATHAGALSGLVEEVPDPEATTAAAAASGAGEAVRAAVGLSLIVVAAALVVLVKGADATRPVAVPAPSLLSRGGDSALSLAGPAEGVSLAGAALRRNHDRAELAADFFSSRGAAIEACSCCSSNWPGG